MKTFTNLKKSLQSFSELSFVPYPFFKNMGLSFFTYNYSQNSFIFELQFIDTDKLQSHNVEIPTIHPDFLHCEIKKICSLPKLQHKKYISRLSSKSLALYNQFYLSHKASPIPQLEAYHLFNKIYTQIVQLFLQYNGEKIPNFEPTFLQVNNLTNTFFSSTQSWDVFLHSNFNSSNFSTKNKKQHKKKKKNKKNQQFNSCFSKNLYSILFNHEFPIVIEKEDQPLSTYFKPSQNRQFSSHIKKEETTNKHQIFLTQKHIECPHPKIKELLSLTISFINNISLFSTYNYTKTITHFKCSLLSATLFEKEEESMQFFFNVWTTVICPQLSYSIDNFNYSNCNYLKLRNTLDKYFPTDNNIFQKTLDSFFVEKSLKEFSSHSFEHYNIQKFAQLKSISQPYSPDWFNFHHEFIKLHKQPASNNTINSFPNKEELTQILNKSFHDFSLIYILASYNKNDYLSFFNSTQDSESQKKAAPLFTELKEVASENLDYLKNIFFKSLDKDIYIQQIDRKFLLDCIVLAYKKNPQHIKDMIPSLSKMQHVNLFIEILNHSSKDNDYLDILDSLLNMKCFLSSFKALQSNLKYGENTIHNPLFAILLKTNTKLFESSYIDKIIDTLYLCNSLNDVFKDILNIHNYKTKTSFYYFHSIYSDNKKPLINKLLKFSFQNFGNTFFQEDSFNDPSISSIIFDHANIFNLSELHHLLDRYIEIYPLMKDEHCSQQFFTLTFQSIFPQLSISKKLTIFNLFKNENSLIQSNNFYDFIVDNNITVEFPHLLNLINFSNLLDISFYHLELLKKSSHLDYFCQSSDYLKICSIFDIEVKESFYSQQLNCLYNVEDYLLFIEHLERKQSLHNINYYLPENNASSIFYKFFNSPFINQSLKKYLKSLQTNTHIDTSQLVEDFIHIPHSHLSSFLEEKILLDSLSRTPLTKNKPIKF